jgi:glutathione synthase/RimK-type ligase-like ATP-grasp enzyme
MPSTTLPNRERALVRILREIAGTQQLHLTILSHDWIIRLEREDIVRYVYGYNFELNSAAAQLLANDKSAVAEVLRYRQIPHVEHKLFLHPRLSSYISNQGNWAEMIAYARQYDFKVVCKPNDGTGGEDVFRARSQPELEQVVQRLLESHRAICLSPYYEISQEYRVIVLDSRCELIYAKQRPTITGDGRSTLADLIAAQIDRGAIPASVAARAMKANESRLDDILDQGVEVTLDWKHNLAHGAYPVIVTDQPRRQQLEALALACAAELNIIFASIDIIETGSERRVLEANSGVMMEHFAELAPDGYTLARTLYAKAVELMFAKGG